MSDPDESQPAAPERHDPYAALRSRDYRLYLAGSTVANVGFNMQATAIGWDIWERTRNPFALGMVGLVQVLPVIGLSLPAGHVVDHFDRRRVLLFAEVLVALSALGLTIIAMAMNPAGVESRTADPAVWWIYLCLFVGGIGRAFHAPARASLMPQLVPKEDFSNAVMWNSAGWQIASIGGPLAAGALIRWKDGATLVYLITFFAIAVFCGALTAVRGVPFVPVRKAMSVRSLLAGARFVWNTKILLATITMDMFGVLLGGAVALLPIFASDILKVGPVGLGAMRAAPAIGALVMGVIIAHRPPMKRAGRAFIWAVVGFGASTVVFGLSKWFWLSWAMLFLTGAFDNVSVVVRHSLVQLLTPDDMRGRVSAVNTLFINISNEMGDFESGFIANLLGRFMPATVATMATVVSGGVGTIVVVGVVALVWPQVRKFGSLTGKH